MPCWLWAHYACPFSTLPSCASLGYFAAELSRQKRAPNHQCKLQDLSSIVGVGTYLTQNTSMAPEGPGTQCLRFVVPKTILQMVFGTREHGYLNPLGSSEGQSWKTSTYIFVLATLSKKSPTSVGARMIKPGIMNRLSPQHTPRPLKYLHPEEGGTRMLSCRMYRIVSVLAQ